MKTPADINDGVPVRPWIGGLREFSLDDLREAQELLDSMEPLPRVFVARHDVPAGSAFRYYNTRGELIVYVNRGDIEELPRRKREEGLTWDGLMMFTVPVVHE